MKMPVAMITRSLQRSIIRPHSGLDTSRIRAKAEMTAPDLEVADAEAAGEHRQHRHQHPEADGDAERDQSEHETSRGSEVRARIPSRNAPTLLTAATLCDLGFSRRRAPPRRRSEPRSRVLVTRIRVVTWDFPRESGRESPGAAGVGRTAVTPPEASTPGPRVRRAGIARTHAGTGSPPESRPEHGADTSERDRSAEPTTAAAHRGHGRHPEAPEFDRAVPPGCRSPRPGPGGCCSWWP